MSDVKSSKKANTLDQLLQQEYGLKTNPGPETGVVSVGIIATKLCSGNPNRVALMFFNLGVNNIYIYIDNKPSSARGILVAGGGGVATLNWRDDMTLISNDWYGIAPAGATNLQVVEVVTN